MAMRNEWSRFKGADVGACLATAGEGAGGEPAGVVVDVRAPGEFAKGAIHGAVNLPLFEDAERAEIGTLYKMMGKDKAIHRGLEMLNPRLAEYAERFAPYLGRRVVVYCARGGMRSESVVALLQAIGHDAVQLPGGYKAFRNFALEVMEHGLPPRLIVIHGCTGTGKTLLLQRLPNHLDLEDLAQHRSSVFGGIHLQPRTQQHFEAHLVSALAGLDYTRPVWVEGESRKIGDVFMPDALRVAMDAAPCVLVEASMEVRVARIIAEYGQITDVAKTEGVAALRTLTPLLGRDQVEHMAEQVMRGELAPVVETLLRGHYDKRYTHAMRNYRFGLRLSSDGLDDAVAQLRAHGDALSAHPAAWEATENNHQPAVAT